MWHVFLGGGTNYRLCYRRVLDSSCLQESLLPSLHPLTIFIVFYYHSYVKYCSSYIISKVDISDLWKIGWDGMDLIGLAQDRDQWRALVNTVMNLRVP
jgi:hypothetical protein